MIPTAQQELVYQRRVRSHKNRAWELSGEHDHGFEKVWNNKVSGSLPVGTKMCWEEKDTIHCCQDKSCLYHLWVALLHNLYSAQFSHLQNDSAYLIALLREINGTMHLKWLAHSQAHTDTVLLAICTATITLWCYLVKQNWLEGSGLRPMKALEN